MAARNGISTSVALALGAAAAKTAIQLLSVNIAIKLIEFGISFDGASNTAVPVLVEIVRQTTAGTFASAVAPVKADSDVGDALNTTAQQGASVEPTTTDVLRAWYVHPQTGVDIQTHDLAPLVSGAGERIAVRLTAPATVNATCYLAFEE